MLIDKNYSNVILMALECLIIICNESLQATHNNREEVLEYLYKAERLRDQIQTTDLNLL